MKSLKCIYGVLLIFVFVAHPVKAQGKITWDTGFPKAGKVGCMPYITIKGTITPATGWSFKSATARVWLSGQAVSEFNVTTNGKNPVTFNQDLQVMLLNTKYNVIVEAVLTNNCKNATIITAPAAVTTPK
jgi:hypothetical protein